MFLLDANIFIDAARRYYSPEIAPTFWQWLADEHDAGNLASIKRVREEIDDGKEGHLRNWAAELPRSFWLAPSATEQSSMGQLSEWVTDAERNYRQEAQNEFLGSADYYLVAQAHSGGHTVVTFEESRPESKKRVLIPDACRALRVPYTEPFSVYRTLGLRFK